MLFDGYLIILVLFEFKSDPLKSGFFKERTWQNYLTQKLQKLPPQLALIIRDNFCNFLGQMILSSIILRKTDFRLLIKTKPESTLIPPWRSGHRALKKHPEARRAAAGMCQGRIRQCGPMHSTPMSSEIIFRLKFSITLNTKLQITDPFICLTCLF